VGAAQPGDAIRICAGVYNGTITIDKSLTLIGTGDGVSSAVDTVLRPSVNGTTIRITAGSVTLQHLRITGGSTSGNGGGIYDTGGGNLTLTDCTVTGNTAGNQGVASTNGAAR
jgi:hypothetical protein